MHTVPITFYILCNLINPLPVKPEDDYRFPRRLSVSLSVRLSVQSVSVHSVCLPFLSRPLRYWLEIWYMNWSWHHTDQVGVLSRLTYFYRGYCPLLKFRLSISSLPSFIKIHQVVSEKLKMWKFTDGRRKDGQTERRTDDGRCAMTIAHLSLWLRWSKNCDVFEENPFESRTSLGTSILLLTVCCFRCRHSHWHLVLMNLLSTLLALSLTCSFTFKMNS